MHGECPEEDFSAIPPVDFNDEDHWAGRRRRQVQFNIVVAQEYRVIVTPFLSDAKTRRRPRL